jgi:outer membrane receptor protein involved in Fe transport
MSRLTKRACASSVLALSTVWGAAAAAQTAPTSTPPAAQVQASASSADTVEEVVVTGSRVARAGFTAPTPVTVLGGEQLTASSPTTLGESLKQIPALNNSVGPRGAQTSSGQGGAYLDLRGLGPSRTLTLLDGRRFVPGDGSGLVDTNLFPQALVDRVEVVTGGASAAYGSDAVGGVVNFILNKKFEGFKGEVQGGVSNYNDDYEQKYNFAYGKGFAEGRGHVIGSLEYFKSNGVDQRLDRPVAQKSCQVITLPAGSTTLRDFACGVRVSNANFGGLITNTALAGTTFTADGSPIPFNYGTLRTGSTMVGGDGVIPQFAPLTSAINKRIAFLRGSWDLTPKTNVYLEGSYGVVALGYQVGSYHNQLGNTALTIRRDNAFLPTSLRDRMTTLNLQTFSLGRYDNDIPQSKVTTDNTTYRLVGGISGEIADWKWDGYFERGDNKRKLQIGNDLLQARYVEAADAVVSPSTGAIVCRSSLTSPGNGCVPINVFGYHPPSEGAFRYITATNAAIQKSYEHLVAFNLSGEPISTWAGPVSLALGAEYREQGFDQKVDGLSETFNPVTNSPGPFRVGNPKAQSGSYNIKEGYIETVVPLAKDVAWAKELELNAAARYTDYSTSGGVTTWKVGLSYAPIEGVRFRATRSRDIRAPNLYELYQKGQSNYIVSIFDRVRGVTATNVKQLQLGNPNLVPEEAETTTFGVVYQPTFAPGLGLSVDYYNIDIQNAIATPTPQQLIDDCAAGSQARCAFLYRDAAGGLIGVDLVNLNLSAFKTRGVDIEASYGFDLSSLKDSLPGRLSTRVIGSYVDTFTSIVPGTTVVNRAGEANNPQWRWNAQATYDADPWSLFVQARYTGEVSYDLSTAATDLRQLKIKPETLIDTRIAYKLPTASGAWTAYFAVNNVFNNLPPEFAPTAGSYDPIGRFYRTGVKFVY